MDADPEFPPTASGMEGDDALLFGEERPAEFGNPEEFVQNFLAPHIRRRLGGRYTWCSQWWAHEEALSRITALWLAFEYLRWEGALGMSTWWLHHADPHLSILLSKDDGPFAACKPGRHEVVDLLPTSPAPAGLWEAAGFANLLS